MSHNYIKYNRKILEQSAVKERKSILKQLEQELTHRLSRFDNWEDYWKEVDCIIFELKEVGHDLWSHDYDGIGRHLWGWDYMHLEKAGYLQI